MICPTTQAIIPLMLPPGVQVCLPDGRRLGVAEFGAPDGEPVRFVVLLATPTALAHKHLEVIGALARMMRNSAIRDALFRARTAEEIHEIIQSEEAETFNYFVDV